MFMLSLLACMLSSAICGHRLVATLGGGAIRHDYQASLCFAALGSYQSGLSLNLDYTPVLTFKTFTTVLCHLLACT